MRWVSLLPAATAWIKALKHTRNLIGRSHLDEEGRRVRSLPACTHLNLQAPRESWEAFLSPFRMNLGVLANLKPDAILTNFQTHIPDMDEQMATQMLQKAVGYPVKVFSCHARSWEDYQNQARQLGEVLQKPNLLKKLLNRARKRQEKLLQKSAALTGEVSALVLTPTASSELIEVQGGWAAHFAPWIKMKLCVSVAPFESRLLRLEEVARLEPEVLILAHPENSLARAGQMLATWSRHPLVQALPAYRRKRLYAMDGLKALFWSGPDLIATAEALYEILHTPNHRFNKHLGTLWAPLL